MSIEIVKIKPEFTDERGAIARILDHQKPQIRAILRISHKADTPPRGNHFHKKDIHWVYVESGKMKYSEKDTNDPNSKVETVILGPGDLVVSKPGIAHAMRAIEDTVFWAFTTEKREQDKYEEDTVRIKIV